MKGWELAYSKEVLDGAKECRVEISHNNDKEIIASVDGFEVVAPIAYKSPHYIFCNCSSKYPCQHEAALMYHIEKHPELIGAGKISDLINSVGENHLKEFLICEMDRNPQLKDAFLKEFGGYSSADYDYYSDKLNRVFKTGEDSEFQNHGIYNIDMMAYGLMEFMAEEFPKLLNVYEYSFAAKLAVQISEKLGDEFAVSHDSWYDLALEFMEWVYILEDSIYLTGDERRLLSDSTSRIISYL